MTTSKTSSKTPTSPLPNNERAHITHSFSMPADLYRALELCAGNTMLSKSRIVQEALKVYLHDELKKGR